MSTTRKNPAIEKIHAYFGVDYTNNIGHSPKWAEWCKRAEVAPDTHYWLAEDLLFIMDPDTPERGAAQRGFDFSQAEPVCVVARSVWTGGHGKGVNRTQHLIGLLHACGWQWDDPAQEWRLNDTGEGYDAVAPNAAGALRMIAHVLAEI